MSILKRDHVVPRECCALKGPCEKSLGFEYVGVGSLYNSQHQATRKESWGIARPNGKIFGEVLGMASSSLA